MLNKLSDWKFVGAVAVVTLVTIYANNKSQTVKKITGSN